MRERMLHGNGIDLHVLEDGPGDGFPVVLAHGFPELAFSWRHQLPALAAAWCRAVAADGRGYGRSSRPDPVVSYDILHLTDDLLAVLDDLGQERAVFVGHDWGAIVVWQLALLSPARVAGVVGMSVPFMPRGALPPTETMRNVFGDAFFYMLYFQQPGVADADLGADVATTLRRMLGGVTTVGADPERTADFFRGDGRGFVERLAEPETLPDWLTQEELDHYVAEFRRTGFTGGINWYRNLDRNWSITEHLDGAHVTVPSLFIGGTHDPVLMMSPPAAMQGWLDDHRGTALIDGAGHWVQQEKPDEVNDALVAFVASVREGST